MEFLKANKKIIIWLLVGVSFVLMLLTVSYKYKPAFFNKYLTPIVTVPQNLISDFSDWNIDRKEYNKDYEEIIAQNKLLQEENDNLKNEFKKYELVKKENDELTKTLGVSESYPDYEKVTANVISKDPTPWYDTFIIDVGTEQGIKPNMVVVADGGLVGKVVECSYTYSKVVGIIDDFSSVSGIVTRNDALGFVKGNLSQSGDGTVKMDLFDIDDEVLEGDEIVTSHLSEIYPKGIPIGYVKEVYTDSKGLSKYAKIVPYVDFKDLKHVVVIKEDFKKENDMVKGVE